MCYATMVAFQLVVTIMVACRAMWGLHGKRPKPIIKDGTLSNQQRNGGNDYRSSGAIRNGGSGYRSLRSQGNGTKILMDLDSI